MSLDLHEEEIRERDVASPKTSVPEASAWDGFARGTGMTAMQTFAKAGRAASMALAAPAVAFDALGNGADLQDKFFKWHDETFGEAVDYWTPKADEVGVAGQITGQLLATLPMVIASPAAAVAATGLGTMEDLVRKGVEPAKAIAAGEVQAAGLGLSIYVPVLGQTLAQRVLLGGAGFNVFQGAATRGASQAILEGTPAEGDFQALDPTALTLDAIMGAAFGAIAHVSPAQRAQSAEVTKKLAAWAQSLKPSDVDALLVMRQAQHVNADSLPGTPAGPEDVGAHVARVKQALEQLATDKPVNVADLPEGKFEADPTRMQEMAARADELVRLSDDVRQAEGLPRVPETEAPPAPRGAEPPPPRGDEGRPGGAEAKSAATADSDPIVLEAKRFSDENEDLSITVGRDAEGKPIKQTLKEFLGESDADVKKATADSELFMVAASCMLGGA